MLLDTGADVSLVPKGVIERLGISILAGPGYRLLGFDGSASVADAAEVDILFLTKTFRGRFLLIEQEYGILGRDVLNLVRLLFDGTHLTWTELT